MLLAFACLATLVSAPAAQSCTTQQVTFGPGGVWPDHQSLYPFISHDGRFVGFTSWATVFFPGASQAQPVATEAEQKTGGQNRCGSAAHGTIEEKKVAVMRLAAAPQLTAGYKRR